MAEPQNSSDFDFRSVLSEGDTISWPQGPGEPLGLTRKLVAQRHDLPRVKLLLGMTTSETVTADCADRFSLLGINGAGHNRKLISEGGMRVIPAHISEVPDLIASRRIPVDVVLIRIRPARAPGFVSLGVVADYVQDLVAAARCVIAEVDHRLPITGQDALLPVNLISHWTESDGPEMMLPDPEPSNLDRTVAARVAALIPDGATIQLGIGALPVSVCQALSAHRDLGLHSGVISDAAVDLLEAGVITNSKKGRDVGTSVTGCLFGTRRLIEHVDLNPAFAMRSARYTHNHSVLASLRRLYSINSAIEVDLTGQINAEMAGTRYLGAIGGQVDFVRGAKASEGGQSIIALHSITADGTRSKIVGSLPGSPVTTARSDVDVVVTEFGVAELRGLDFDARACALIEVAHPDFQEDLERSNFGHSASKFNFSANGKPLIKSNQKSSVS